MSEDLDLTKPRAKMMTLPAWQCLALEETAEYQQIPQVEIVRRALESYLPTLGVDKEEYLRRTAKSHTEVGA